MYRAIYNPSKYRSSERNKKNAQPERFLCLYCGSVVYTQPAISGVQNRNHCPYCLSSRHVDHAQAGDRMSACKGLMQPVGLAKKPGRNKYGPKSAGELMLIHRCSTCGKLSINRLAADDEVDSLLDIFRASMESAMSLLDQLKANGIHMLTQEDSHIINEQLVGCCRQ